MALAAPATRAPPFAPTGATIEREDVEERVLGGLNDRLMHPALIDIVVEEYRQAWNATQAGASALCEKTRCKLA